MQYNNIDYTDAAINTKAPFRFECPLRLWGSTLPLGSFISAKIYLPEYAKPPVRLYSVTEREAAFHDDAGSYIGSWHFDQKGTSYGDFILHLLRNESGVITGHIAVGLYTSALLKQSAVLAGGLFYTDVSDFILLPQCHLQSFSGTCRAVVIDNKIQTGDVVIGTANRVTATQENAQIAINLEGVYDKPKENRICVLEIGDLRYWIGDQHLHLVTGVQSNLRVITTGAAITLKGVMDV